MGSFPKADADIKKLSEMVYAPVCTKALFAGIELEVFSELAEPKTHGEVAEKLGLHPDNTRHLLDVLTAIGLLEKNQGVYQNRELAGKYLVRDSDLFVGSHIRKYSIVAGFDDLDIVKWVKDGPGDEFEDKKGLEAEELYGDYAQIIKDNQRAGRAHDVAELVSSLPEFDSFKKMLDLGGGPGLIGMAIVERHPEMKGVIFDIPNMTQVALKALKEYNLEDRFEILSGDYMVDAIGEGYDFILASGALNFAKPDLDLIIQKIYDALNPNGVFMCIQEGMTEEKTDPREMVLGWLPSSLRGASEFSFDKGEISDAILRNGFRSVCKSTGDYFMGEMDIDIARK
ncbi:methyltransferase [Desulforamulus ruminis]|uniref:methyltransferase n=1 Tax=Desulforamulus ruminis TaxID=1564 RepID=UPI002FD8C266